MRTNRVSLHRCNQSAQVDRNEYDAAGKIITCPFPNCLHTWCRDCQQPVALDGNVDDKGCVHSCDGSAELENLMGVRGWKHCPGCKIPTEKIEGCNHMRVCTLLVPGSRRLLITLT